MNLTKFFNLQRQLDEHILDEHPELKGQDNLDWKILALQVELGECANEWRGFKKWSNDQEPRTRKLVNGDIMKGEYEYSNPLLEEYVDCLHFILSIGLEKGYDNMKYEHLYNESVKFGVTFIDKTVTNQFVNMFYFVSQFENETCRESYED